MCAWLCVWLCVALCGSVWLCVALCACVTVAVYVCVAVAMWLRQCSLLMHRCGAQIRRAAVVYDKRYEALPDGVVAWSTTAGGVRRERLVRAIDTGDAHRRLVALKFFETRQELKDEMGMMNMVGSDVAPHVYRSFNHHPPVPNDTLSHEGAWCLLAPRPSPAPLASCLSLTCGVGLNLLPASEATRPRAEVLHVLVMECADTQESLADYCRSRYGLVAIAPVVVGVMFSLVRLVASTAYQGNRICRQHGCCRSACGVVCCPAARPRHRAL